MRSDIVVWLWARHKSKFVQYLMFYICGLDPKFMDSFLGAISAGVVSADGDLSMVSDPTPTDNDRPLNVNPPAGRAPSLLSLHE